MQHCNVSDKMQLLGLWCNIVMSVTKWSCYDADASVVMSVTKCSCYETDVTLWCQWQNTVVMTLVQHCDVSDKMQLLWHWCKSCDVSDKMQLWWHWWDILMSVTKCSVKTQMQHCDVSDKIQLLWHWCKSCDVSNKIQVLWHWCDIVVSLIKMQLLRHWYNIGMSLTNCSCYDTDTTLWCQWQNAVVMTLVQHCDVSH